jgi:predicted GIY-YIG superfamily endonuclease
MLAAELKSLAIARQNARFDKRGRPHHPIHATDRELLRALTTMAGPPFKLAEGQHAAYVIVSEAGQVLYVGLTRRPANRLSQHRSKGTVQPTDRVAWLVTSAPRKDALRVETLLIANLHPLRNKIGSDFQFPRGCQGLTLTELAALADHEREHGWSGLRALNALLGRAVA